MLNVKEPKTANDSLTVGTFLVDIPDEDPLELVLLCDVPHLLKAARNALLNNKEFTVPEEMVKKYKLPSDKIKYSVIEKLINFVGKKEMKISPHLKKQFLKLNNFTKMNVDPAKYVLSREAAAAIRWCIKNYPDDFPPEDETTAHFCEMVSTFYDLGNSRTSSICYHKSNLDRRCAMMEEFRDYYISLKMSDKQRDGLKPSQKGVILSVNGLNWLAKFFILEQEFDFFLPGRVSNDSVENLHSIIRGYNRLPTPLMYRRFLKAIAMTQCIKPYSKNMAYELDNSEDQSFLSDLSQAKKELEDDQQEVVFNFFKDDDFKPKDFSEENAVSYFGGYILGHSITEGKKHKKNKSTCAICEDLLVAKAEDPEQMCNSLIKDKEYIKGKEFLVYPSAMANKMFQIAEETFRRVRDSLFLENKNLKIRITNEVLTQINLNVQNAPQCHLKLLFSRIVEARLNFWSEFTNGQIQTRYSSAMGSKSTAAEKVLSERKK